MNRRDVGSRFARKDRGFSALELMIVIAVGMIASGMSFIMLRPVVRNARVSNAYAATLMQLRRARAMAIGDRKVYRVTFNQPASSNGTAQIQRVDAGTPTVVVSTLTLPNDVQFRVEPGFPTAAPDGFGNGTTAINFDVDFGGGVKQIYFQPDGSARDTAGRINNGIIYLARSGEILSGRAITLYGATGRIRGWRIAPNGGSYTWLQQ